MWILSETDVDKALLANWITRKDYGNIGEEGELHTAYCTGV